MQIKKKYGSKKRKKSSFLEQTLKLDSHHLKEFFSSFNESPLKIMKNTFYFILKALLVLKISKKNF